MRQPDFIIGPVESPYLRRWWIIPRNRFFNIYLHEILRSDDDRALHDHPWRNCSVILSGTYVEWVRGHEGDPGTERPIVRKRGSVVLRRACAAHRLVVPSSQPCWTLFITGPRVREWGFYCPKGWLPWQQFVAPGDAGQIGRGCE